MPSNSEIINEHNDRLRAILDAFSGREFVYVDTQQNITGLKIFNEMVGISNVNGTTDYLKHINNNFLISTSEGTNLLNIDEGLNKIYAFDKELAFKEDIGESTGGGTVVTVGSSKVDSLLFDSDPQTQITAISNRVKPAIVNVSHNENTGEFTFTRDNGTSFTVDTLLEKVVTNFTYNENTQNLELTLEDGTIKYIPMTAFIDDYSGIDGDVVTVSVSNDNKISAVVKNGTITKNHLSETVQATLDEVGSNSGKIDTILNTWDNKADVDASNLSSDNIVRWKGVLNILSSEDKQFVEEEILKTKNLFDPRNIMIGARSNSDGTILNTSNYLTNKNLIDVKSNSSIVLSFETNLTDIGYSFVFYNNGVFISSSLNVSTVIVPSNANQVAVNFSYTSTLKLTDVYDIQLEYGTIATEYVPYYGYIVHKKEVGATVEDSYISSDGRTWYRIWSDGWKECGMVIDSSNGISNPTLPITFADKNYIATCGIYGSGYYVTVRCEVNNTSQVTLVAGKSNWEPVGAETTFRLYCCGY